MTAETLQAIWIAVAFICAGSVIAARIAGLVELSLLEIVAIIIGILTAVPPMLGFIFESSQFPIEFRAGFGIAAIVIPSVVIAVSRSRKRRHVPKPQETSLEEQHKNTLYHSHLEAQLFWESWRYHPVAKFFRRKDGRKLLPKAKLLLNKDTKKAYHVGLYLRRKILDGEIPYIDRKIKGESIDYTSWARDNGYEFCDWLPSEEELKPITTKTNEEITLPQRSSEPPIITREQLSAKLTFRQMLTQAKEQILFLAVTMEDVAQFNPDPLVDILSDPEKHVKVTITILDPAAEDIIKKKEDALPITKDLKAAIVQSHKALCELSQKLPQGIEIVLQKHRIDISDSIVVIDPETENAWIKRENFGYSVSPGQRSNQYGSKKEFPAFYHRYYGQYKNAVRNAEPYPCSKQ